MCRVQSWYRYNVDLPQGRIWHDFVFGTQLFCALAKSYHIWHTCVSSWNDVLHTFMTLTFGLKIKIIFTMSLCLDWASCLSFLTKIYQKQRSEWVSLRKTMSFVSIQICWLGVPSVSFTSDFNLVASCYLSSLTLVFNFFCRKKAAFPVAESAVFFNVYFKAFAWYLCVVYSPTQTQEPLPLTLKGCKR